MSSHATPPVTKSRSGIFPRLDRIGTKYCCDKKEGTVQEIASVCKDAGGALLRDHHGAVVSCGPSNACTEGASCEEVCQGKTVEIDEESLKVWPRHRHGTDKVKAESICKEWKKNAIAVDAEVQERGRARLARG